MAKLPAVVKARGRGGTTQTNAAISTVLSTSLMSPEDTFGVLRDLLQGLESRLRSVRKDVERQEKLAAATPSIWPANGWLTGPFGGRSDPFTGEPGFHQGLDISTSKGQPVYATADGSVESASYTGDYGNLIVLRHDFGLTTRYGHLSGFNVKHGADRAPRRRHRLRRIDRSLDRRAPALRNPGERQAAQSRCSSSRNRQPLNTSKASKRSAARSRPPKAASPALDVHGSWRLRDSALLQSSDTHGGSVP